MVHFNRGLSPIRSEIEQSEYGSGQTKLKEITVYRIVRQAEFID